MTDDEWTEHDVDIDWRDPEPPDERVEVLTEHELEVAKVFRERAAEVMRRALAEAAAINERCSRTLAGLLRARGVEIAETDVLLPEVDPETRAVVAARIVSP